MIRVLVVSRSAVARAGYQALLASQGFEPRAEPELGATPDADVIVLDWERPEAPELPEAPVPVVLLAGMNDGARLREALRSGIQAVLPREVSAEELASAVRAVAAGLVALPPEAIETLLAAPARPAVLASAEDLTAREVEVLRLLAEGDANKEIAYKLGLSEHTVKFHVASILAKLGASSRTEAVTLGLRRGLILL